MRFMVLSGFKIGGEVAAVFLAGVCAAAFGSELAARVLPAFAGVVPMETELRELAPDLLGGLLGERDPDPLADNLGQIVLGRHPTPEQVQNAVGRKRAVFLALLVVHIRKYAGRLGLLWCRGCGLRCGCLALGHGRGLFLDG